MNAKEKLEKIEELVAEGASIDGAHHKQWYFNEIIKVITETDKKYKKWVEKYESGSDGPQTYIWDEGIAP